MTANLRGILLMVAAMAGFAVEDALIKAASAAVPAGQIILIIAVVGLGAFGLWARVAGIPLAQRAAFAAPVVGRTLAEIVACFGIVTALALTTLSTVTVIIQAAPIVVVAAAALLLGEQVGWRRWTAVGVGFAGVLLILRPGAAGFDPNALWAVLGVAGLAARDIFSRRIDPGLPTPVVAVWGYVGVILLGVAMTLQAGGPVWPDPAASLAIAGASLIGLVAYWAIIEATRAGDVAAIAPFRYSRLVFGVAIGVVFFAETLDRATLAGAALVIGSGLYTLYRERMRRVEGPATALEEIRA
ncbi:MAG: DMT family transporter [Gemmobacter sp.]